MSLKQSPVVLLVVVLLSALFACTTSRSDEAIDSNLSLAEAMGGDTTGYARADAVRDFVFPDDHGPHPAFKTEWWYYTGNLEAENGRRFGFQFTLFRIALTPPDADADSIDSTVRATDWATNQLYMGHFAVSDVGGEQFYAAERFSRGAAGLAGAQSPPFRVWLEDWETSGDSTGFPMRVRAAQDGAALDLMLDPVKPLVFQGDRGLDPKGDEPGNASYYYSATRMAATGTVTVAGETFDVEGLAWMDREWSTSALGDDQVGWDWFALQLDDGRDLMYYQLRTQDGTPDPESDGVLVGEDGTKTPLYRDDVTLEVTDTWTSPLGGTYPSGWRLRVPAQDLDLTITPYFEAQELDVSVRYWEGAVRVDGTANGQPIRGSGYVELTGYAGGSSPVPS